MGLYTSDNRILTRGFMSKAGLEKVLLQGARRHLPVDCLKAGAERQTQPKKQDEEQLLLCRFK